MATEAQIAANRRNATKSTGPRTVEGKEKSRMNALKDGLSALDTIKVVLPTESQQEANAFRDALLAGLNPVGGLEERLATEVVECSWRLRRATNIELGVLAHGVADAEVRYLTGRKRMFEVTNADVTETMLADAGIHDPEEVVAITSETVHEDLESMIDDVRGQKRAAAARLAAGFIEDAIGPNALAKLSRYETSLFNRRNRALAQLTALQAARTVNTKEDA